MSAGPVVIVGGGPAGLSCARSYRERGGRERVFILSADPDPPYERPALSKEYLRGEREREQLTIEEPDFFERNSIELRTATTVRSIDPEARLLESADGESFGYGSCVLATGSRPARPDIEGIDCDSVLVLRSVADCERLRDAVGPGTRVLVAGSGFIGCEVAVSLADRGAEVTQAAAAAYPMQARLGADVGARIGRWLVGHGIALRAGRQVESIDEGDDGAAALVRLTNERIEVDIVVAALGIERQSELAGAAGVDLVGDLVPTDERMRTSVEGLLAVGDVAFAHNAAAGRRLPVEHWGEALRHGEIAGAVLAGDPGARWESVPGFWSGLGERTIKQVAWGDGFDRVELTDHGGDAFTARYVGDGELVGVLTHEADGDYESGRGLVEARTAWS